MTLVLYWVGYVAIVSWRALRHDKSSSTEEMIVILLVLVIEGLITLWPLGLMFAEARRNKRKIVSKAAKEEAISGVPVVQCTKQEPEVVVTEESHMPSDVSLVPVEEPVEQVLPSGHLSSL